MSIVFEAKDAATRCLWVTAEHVYVGTCHREDEHLLAILDKGGKLAQSWRTPFLVSDVAIAGDVCHASLGPGYLMSFAERGFGAKPEPIKVDANSPKLAVHGEALWWGTSWGEIHSLETGLVTSVKKWLVNICVDRERICAGYEDGKVRVFSHAGKRTKMLKVGGRAARCAMNDQLLVTINQTGGDATIWSLDLEERATFLRDTRRAVYGVVGLALFAPYIVSHTHDDLELHDFNGTLVGRWEAPGAQLEDVWLDGDVIYVAAGPHVHRLALAEIMA